MNLWDGAMRLALGEAVQAARWGDVPIGAVVVDEFGEVCAKAGNERELTGDPTAHAELVALRKAARVRGRWRFDDCTLVVTLEPCAMCAGAVVQSRLARLVFGAFDDKAGAVASLWDVVRDPRVPHRVEVISGILAEESQRLLSGFFSSRR